MLQLSTQPQSVGQVFLASFRAWPEVAKKVQLLVLLMFVWLALPYFLEPSLNTYNPFSWHYKAIEHWGLVIIYFVVMMFFYGAIFYRARQLMHGLSSSFIGALGVGLEKLFWLIPAFIMAAVSLAIGYLAFFIPGLIMMVIFMCYFPMIIADELDPITAYKRSFKMVWPNWWRAAIIVLLPTFLIMIIGIGIDRLAMWMLAVPHPVGTRESWIFAHVIKLLIGVVYFPFYVTLLVVLLNDLKLRYEKNV